MSVAASSPPWDLLARHLAGEATPADEAAVRAWQAAEPSNAALWQQLTGVWTEAGQAAAPAFTAADTARAWQQFETTVLGPPAPSAPSAPTASPPVTPPVPFQSASWLAGWGKATALLVVGASTGWLLRASIPPAVDAAPPIQAEAVVPAALPSITAQQPGEIDLIFEDEPVRLVARRLERAFAGTHVHVDDSVLANQRFTGTFRAARVGQVLRVVAITTGAITAQQADSAWVLRRAAD
jgi:ferric-dicitrate binding protein FerR (iron transport regulator)